MIRDKKWLRLNTQLPYVQLMKLGSSRVTPNPPRFWDCSDFSSYLSFSCGRWWQMLPLGPQEITNQTCEAGSEGRFSASISENFWTLQLDQRKPSSLKTSTCRRSPLGFTRVQLRENAVGFHTRLCVASRPPSAVCGFPDGGLVNSSKWSS